MRQTSAGSMEANLDIQYTVGLTSPLHNHFYAVGGKGELVPDVDQPSVARGQNEPFQQFFQHLLNVEKNLPHTISISYAENEQNIPPTVSSAVCNQIAQLGIRGVSVLSGSGDWGVGSGCLTNDGRNKTWFTPIFPASCPYITSVGGVTGTQPEKAIGFSSGGFSDRFPRPAYQESQVSSFLSKHGAQWAQYYNAKGRGFPDISAQAQGFRIINGGRAALIGGTSASTPVVSSVVALLNAKRLQDGQPLLGFLNPWLYSVDTKVATDITQGKSTGCTGRSKISGQPAGKVAGANWAAVKGWDPVTGIGTPKFSAMLQNLPVGKPGARK
jgi:tripeptidyl-peptidase-1